MATIICSCKGNNGLGLGSITEIIFSWEMLYKQVQQKILVASDSSGGYWGHGEFGQTEICEFQ